MSIIDDLRPSIPRGRFWEALAKLRDHDEDDYQAYVDAMWSTVGGEWELPPKQLQAALTKHTGVRFDASRINEIRADHDREDLPV